MIMLILFQHKYIEFHSSVVQKSYSYIYIRTYTYILWSNKQTVFIFLFKYVIAEKRKL